jgi:hypothetical protein
MAKAYYSTVLDNTIEEVWSKISNFNDDRWSGEVTESKSENGKSGSTVGTIRIHTFGDKTAHSDLRAYSNVKHFFTYGFVGTPPLPIDNYESTLRATPITDGNKTFIEWQAAFDCADLDRERLATSLIKSYDRWLTSLKKNLVI